MTHLTRIGLVLGFISWANSTGVAQVGIITTYAGPVLIEGAPATSEAIDQPASVAWDRAGGFYLASLLQNKVYRVTTDGRIHSVAGNGTPGFSGDGGTMTAVREGRRHTQLPTRATRLSSSNWL